MGEAHMIAVVDRKGRCLVQLPDNFPPPDNDCPAVILARWDSDLTPALIGWVDPAYDTACINYRTGALWIRVWRNTSMTLEVTAGNPPPADLTDNVAYLRVHYLDLIRESDKRLDDRHAARIAAAPLN